MRAGNFKTLQWEEGGGRDRPTRGLIYKLGTDLERDLNRILQWKSDDIESTHLGFDPASGKEYERESKRT